MKNAATLEADEIGFVALASSAGSREVKVIANWEPEFA
jgi:hypothetical protein